MGVGMEEGMDSVIFLSSGSCQNSGEPKKSESCFPLSTLPCSSNHIGLKINFKLFCRVNTNVY